jgi:hypothetical protein
LNYKTPAHLSIVLSGKLAGNREVAFAVEACRIQLQDHAARVWGLPTPGVFFYSEDQFTPAKEGAVVAIVDDDGNDSAAGFHSYFSDMPFGLVDLHQSAIFSRTLSHECLELWANAFLDRWIPGPNGLDYAVELCDPCQRQDYLIPVELFGETRDVVVSDFVTPRWFGVAETLHPSCTYGAHIAEPFKLAFGGYAIAKTDKGEAIYLAHSDGAFLERRKIGLFARTGRLIRGVGSRSA